MLDAAMFGLCVLPMILLLSCAAFISDLIMKSSEENLMYGNAKVGDILKPRAKKCNFTTTMRNILAKLGFN